MHCDRKLYTPDGTAPYSGSPMPEADPGTPGPAATPLSMAGTPTSSVLNALVSEGETVWQSGATSQSPPSNSTVSSFDPCAEIDNLMRESPQAGSPSTVVDCETSDVDEVDEADDDDEVDEVDEVDDVDGMPELVDAQAEEELWAILMRLSREAPFTFEEEPSSASEVPEPGVMRLPVPMPAPDAVLMPDTVSQIIDSLYGDTPPESLIEATAAISRACGRRLHRDFVSASLCLHYNTRNVHRISATSLLWMRRVADILNSAQGHPMTLGELRLELASRHALTRSLKLHDVLKGLLRRHQAHYAVVDDTIAQSIEALLHGGGVSRAPFTREGAMAVERAIRQFEQERPHDPDVDAGNEKTPYAKRPTVPQILDLLPENMAFVNPSSCSRIIAVLYGLLPSKPRKKNEPTVLERDLVPGTDDEKALFNLLCQGSGTAHELWVRSRQAKRFRNCTWVKNTLDRFRDAAKTGSIYYVPEVTGNPARISGAKSFGTAHDCWEAAKQGAVKGIVSSAMALHTLGEEGKTGTFHNCISRRSSLVERLPCTDKRVLRMLKSAEYRQRYSDLPRVRSTTKFYRIKENWELPQPGEPDLTEDVRNYFEERRDVPIVKLVDLREKFSSQKLTSALTALVRTEVIEKCRGGYRVRQTENPGPEPMDFSSPSSDLSPSAVHTPPVLRKPSLAFEAAVQTPPRLVDPRNVHPFLQTLLTGTQPPPPQPGAKPKPDPTPWSQLSPDIQELYEYDEFAYNLELTAAVADHSQLLQAVEAHSLQVVHNSGRDLNCWLISLWQHATGNYTSEHTELVNTTRAALAAENLTTARANMTAASPEARRAVQMINEWLEHNGQPPMNIFVISSPHGFAPSVETIGWDGFVRRNPDFSQPPDPTAQTRNVIIHDQDGHFESVARKGDLPN